MGISRVRLYAGLGVGIVAISFASILIRLAQTKGVPTISIAAWRLVVASSVLLPYAWLTGRDEIRRLTGKEIGLLGAAGLFLGLHFAAWIGSLGYTSVASSVVLVSMGPVFVGLGSWALLGERPGPQTLMGIALAAVGSVVVSWGDFDKGRDQLWGDLLALVGAIMVSGYLMIGRKVRARRSLAVYVALVYAVAMAMLLGLALVGRQPLLGFDPAAYGWLLALGLAPQVIGHSTLNWALRHLSATYVSIVTLAEPIGSGLLAFFLLGEALTASVVVGGGMVLAGITIASRAEFGASKK